MAVCAHALPLVRPTGQTVGRTTAQTQSWLLGFRPGAKLAAQPATLAWQPCQQPETCTTVEAEPVMSKDMCTSTKKHVDYPMYMGKLAG